MHFLETLYIDGTGSTDQVHYVSVIFLEIPPLEVSLEKVDTFCRIDTAAKRINFYKGQRM